jgi:glycosyltransferase involved in cell wall biosynthesis
MEAVRRQVRTLFGIQQVDMLRLALPGARPALNRADRLRTGRRFQVLYFGDLRADKGWQRVPDIARSLAAAGDQFRVIMHVGNPRTLARQRNKAARDAIKAANVEIVPGYLSDHDLTQLLADADVVILPYRAEGYSTRGSGVGLDSVAHGVPLIVSAGCTLGELVSCGNGLEAESDDDFASAIIKIRDNYPTFIAGAARAQQASKTWIADSLLPARVAGR